MIIKNLKLSNFFSHKNTSISFDKEVYMITGKWSNSDRSNGSGKSVIVRGIKYALYGDSIIDIKDSRSMKVKNDYMIYNDETDMEVELDFYINQEAYNVKRVIKRGKPPTIYIKKGVNESKKFNVTNGQDMMDKILGCTALTYLNTSYFEQGGLSSFSKLSPRAAKDLVIKLLQLDVYNKYELAAKTTVNNINEKLKTLEINQTMLQQQINNEEKQITETSYTQSDVDKLKEELCNYKFEKSLEVFLANSKQKSIQRLTTQKNEVTNTHNTVVAEIAVRNNRINKLNNLFNNNQCNCPTCEHKLNVDEVKGIITVLTNETLPYSKQIDSLLKEILIIDELISTTSLCDISITKNDGNYEYRVINQIASIEQELKQKTKDKFKIDELKKALNNIASDINKGKNILNQYVILQEAFGKKGIQAHIIENILPEIQTTANNILIKLDSPIRLSIESQKELKKGGKSETLEINVLTKQGYRPYSNYSGGQKTFIDFSLRMSLAILLARRTGNNIQTLILDEVWSELDSTNKQIVAQVIQYLISEFGFKKTLIVSHSDELKDKFSNFINVEFDGITSTIKGNVND